MYLCFTTFNVARVNLLEGKYIIESVITDKKDTTVRKAN